MRKIRSAAILLSLITACCTAYGCGKTSSASSSSAPAASSETAASTSAAIPDDGNECHLEYFSFSVGDELRGSEPTLGNDGNVSFYEFTMDGTELNFCIGDTDCNMPCEAYMDKEAERHNEEWQYVIGCKYPAAVMIIGSDSAADAKKYCEYSVFNQGKKMYIEISYKSEEELKKAKESAEKILKTVNFFAETDNSDIAHSADTEHFSIDCGEKFAIETLHNYASIKYVFAETYDQSRAWVNILSFDGLPGEYKTLKAYAEEIFDSHNGYADRYNASMTEEKYKGFDAYVITCSYMKDYTVKNVIFSSGKYTFNIEIETVTGDKASEDDMQKLLDAFTPKG